MFQCIKATFQFFFKCGLQMIYGLSIRVRSFFPISRFDVHIIKETKPFHKSLTSLKSIEKCFSIVIDNT